MAVLDSLNLNVGLNGEQKLRAVGSLSLLMLFLSQQFDSDVPETQVLSCNLCVII
jgi:hypothetical protein